MSADDGRDTGIPTRAIHEAYLTLQQAHQEYRRARDDGADTHGHQAAFQHEALRFHDLIRHHLKHETAVSDYWNGELPAYTGWDFDSTAEAIAYVEDTGTGVYQTQVHTVARTVEQQVLTDGGQPETMQEWHRLLGLSWDSERLIAYQQDREEPARFYAKVLRAAVLPLRELDHWRADIVTERTSGDGFMAGETRSETRREFQPPQKLIAAKRLLVEAADKLGLLSDIDASTQRTEITREDLEKVEEWRQEQIQ